MSKCIKSSSSSGLAVLVPQAEGALRLGLVVYTFILMTMVSDGRIGTHIETFVSAVV